MAEKKNTTVARLLTGKEMPLTNIEVVLRDTYLKATMRLERQQQKGKKK